VEGEGRYGEPGEGGISGVEGGGVAGMVGERERVSYRGVAGGGVVIGEGWGEGKVCRFRGEGGISEWKGERGSHGRRKGEGVIRGEWLGELSFCK